MSFASDVKTEMINIDPDEPCCIRAELNAMLKFRGFVGDGKIGLTCNAAPVLRRALSLLKKLYPNVRTEISFSRFNRSRRSKHYSFKLALTSQTIELQRAIYSNEFPSSDCCRAAYLRGAFLVGGTINRPESHYHWEVKTTDESAALFLLRSMSRLDFPARIFKRNNQFVVYLKEFDSIIDFLAFTGAEESIDRYEVARNIKDVRILANRLVNCETQNLQRAVDAAQRQLDDIKLILKHKIKLSDALRATCQARLKNPEMSMSELAPLLKITTSGVKFRMGQIHLLAEPLR